MYFCPLLPALTSFSANSGALAWSFCMLSVSVDQELSGISVDATNAEYEAWETTTPLNAMAVMRLTARNVRTRRELLCRYVVMGFLLSSARAEGDSRAR